MAVTITTSPAADVAAFGPVILAGTSSRDPVTTGGAAEEVNINSAQISGGKLNLTLATSSHPLENTDTIIISGMTGSLSWANGRHDVLNVSGISLTTNTDWVGGSGGGGAVVRRANDNLLVLCEVRNASNEVVGTVTAKPYRKGWSVDIRQVLGSMVGSIFSLTPGAISSAAASAAYTVRVYEQWLSAGYNVNKIETPSLGIGGVAHRAATIEGQLSGALPNTPYAAKDKIIVTWLDPYEQSKAVFYPRTATGWGTMTEVTPTFTRKRGAVVYQIPASAVFIHVVVVDTSFSPLSTPASMPSTPASMPSAPLVRVPQTTCNKRLYWLNLMGGYTVTELTDIEEADAVDRVEWFVAKGYKRRRLWTVEETKFSSAYLDGLLLSPEVRDENGNLVRIVSKELVTVADQVRLEIEVEDERNFISQ
jgi:hypothetical protein